MADYKTNNKRKAIKRIIDMYEKKQPIDVSSISNKHILLTCAFRYNDIKTIDTIISSAKIHLYFNKPLRASFKYRNWDLCTVAIQCGAYMSHSPFRYRKNWQILSDMVNNGLKEHYITEKKWAGFSNEFDLDDFKSYYKYYALLKVIYITDIVNIIYSY